MRETELKNYLHSAMELEAQLYKYNCLLDNIKKSLRTNAGMDCASAMQKEIRNGEIINLSLEKERIKPQRKEAPKPLVLGVPRREAFEKDYMWKKNDYTSVSLVFALVFGIITLCGGLCVLLYMLAESSGDLLLFFLLVEGVGIGLVAIYFAINKKLKNECKKAYEEVYQQFEVRMARAREIYKQNCQEVEREYQQNMVVWNENNVRIRARNSEKNRVVQELKIIENDIEDIILVIKEKLQQFYAVNIIFPKYQNFVAVSTFYEYIDSGRCQTLDGGNGAYNIYENEVRQNLIITKLHMIVQQLEEIKQNQYCMYTKLKEIEVDLDESHEIMKQMNGALSNIEASTNESVRIDKMIMEYNSKIHRDMSIIRNLEILSSFREVNEGK